MADNIDIRLRLQNAKRFSQDTKRADKDVRRIGAGAVSAAKGFGRLVAGAAGIYYLGRGIRFIAQEYDEAARAGAQTEAVIKSTGGVAGITRRRVEGLSAALSRQAGIDDELIQSGANVLLTFKNIRNEAGQGNKMFDRATTAALDLSVAFDKDLRSASVMVGKALNDPIKGITALNRVGVTFTEKQKEQVEALVESGNTLDAQRLIIKELESQVKGSAEAQAQPMDKLRVGFGNIAESLGRLAAPTVLKGIEKASDLVSDLDKSLTPIWERGDLGFEEKMERSMPKLERSFRRAKIGPNLARAVETGMPIVADAMARGAPRAAGAFVKGFQETGVWGKLITLGFLATKLGVFKAAGGWAAGQFATSMAGTMAGSGAGSLGGAMDKKKGRFRSIGKGFGRSLGGPMGAALAAATVAFFWEDIKDAFDDVSGNILQDILLPLSPRGSTRDRFDLSSDSDLIWRDRPPPSNNGFTGQPGRPPRNPRARPRNRGPGARTSSFRGGDIVVPVTLLMDGQPVAKAVNRVARDEAGAR